MDLAAIIADCRFSNRPHVFWQSMPNDAWSALEDEMRSHPRLFASAALLRNSWQCSETIADKWRQDYNEVLSWFGAAHAGDRLGAIPRDIVGIIGEYLRIRIIEDASQRKIVCNYVMANLIGWPGEPQWVVIELHATTLTWSSVVQWTRRSDGTCTASELGCLRHLTTNEQERCESLHQMYSNMFPA